ncbi:MAG: TonB family protein [Saprospiraceae bacterium]|nr:TonB family protein [Saprospiraceae bacterium]
MRPFNYAIMLLLLLWTAFSSCTSIRPLKSSPLSNKYWAEYYKIHLTPGSKIIESSPNRTVELYEGRYIVQEYFYDHKILTSRKFYTDSDLTNQEGKAVLYFDNGKKNREMYVHNGKREGEQLIYDDEEGFVESRSIYKEDKLEGPVLEYNRDGKIIRQSFFVRDSLHGERIVYDSTGNIKRKWVYEHGKLIASDPPGEESDILDIQVPPKFPCHPKMKNNEDCHEKSMFAFLGREIRYPRQAIGLGIQGRALVSFDVDVDGSIHDIKVLKGYCNSIRDECIRVVSKMPKWEPGYSNGKPVKVKYILPIAFRMEY